MKDNKTFGKINSIQSLGTVDGPGIRFVIFLQGCNLRCSCCHNPETWDVHNGKLYSVEELIQKISRYKEYFGQTGGLTVSGGEPLLQPKFVQELFKQAHSQGVNTCLDTSGCFLNDQVKELLTYCDRVLLDIKYTTEEAYQKNVGCSLAMPIAFLAYLEKLKIPTTLRQVIIPTKNDTKTNIQALKIIKQTYSVVDKIELLPFRKICQAKYDTLDLDFPFKNISEPTVDLMNELEQLLNS